MPRVRKMIQAPDPEGMALLGRVPGDGMATFKLGMDCIVREFQVAAFSRDGETLDLLGPGRHALSADKLPLLAELLDLTHSKRKTFEAAVYYVNQKVSGFDWESTEPTRFLDRELGRVGIWTGGSCTVRVSDPLRFLKGYAERASVVDASPATSVLAGVIESGLSRILESKLTSVRDIPLLYNELATEVRLALSQDFVSLGVDLIDFFITSVRPTEEAKKALEKQEGRATPGRIESVFELETARRRGRPGSALSNDGEFGPQNPRRLILPQALDGDTPTSAGEGTCPHCGHSENEHHPCPVCHAAVSTGARFCPACGGAMNHPREA